MRFHACDFLTIDAATVRPELTEAMDTTAEVSCRPKSAPEPGAFTFVRPSSFSEQLAASGWLAGLNGSRFVLVRRER
jgi:hypothetical protein